MHILLLPLKGRLFKINLMAHYTQYSEVPKVDIPPKGLTIDAPCSHVLVMGSGDIHHR